MNAASVRNHPSANDLYRFAVGQASLEVIALIEGHLAECPDCCASLKTIAQDSLVSLLCLSVWC